MTLNKTLIAAFITGQVLFISGCSDSQDKDTSATAPATTTSAPSSDPHAGMNLRLAANQGKVLQVTTEGGYSYAEVEQNGKRFWIAGAKQVALKSDDIVTWGEAQEMKDVHSKVLNRTFDSIYFVTNMSTNHARTTMNTGTQAAANSGNSGELISIQNSGGYSYLQVQTQGGELWVAAPVVQAQAGQTITWSGGSVMRDFTSSTLNKTFAAITFAGQVRVIEARPADANAAPSQGKILSLKSGGGYSYAEVETSAGTKWVAAPQAQVAVGDTIRWSGANVMTNFTSSSLKQTFDEILFAGSINKID
ncbi:MAG: GW dipeptide domain-containing protein [Motiliproteus sp.]